MEYVKVENQNNLVRDMGSNAVLNTDRNGLMEYYRKRDIAKKEIQEREETKERLLKMEQEMAEIKNLLREIALLRRSDGN